MSSGWVKLHRQFLEWEWYSDHNVCRLFIHCLIRANHADKKWRGILIKSGSFVSSQANLSVQTGLTLRQIRTCLSKLKTTGEMTVKTTSKYSLYSITYWQRYQSDDIQDDRRETGKRQASDRRATTNKNEKNEKNEKKKELCLDYSGWPDMPSDQTMRDWLLMRKRLKANVSQTVINNFATQLQISVDKGLTVDYCIAECVTRNWRGFKSEWLDNESNKKISTRSLTAVERVEAAGRRREFETRNNRSDDITIVGENDSDIWP